MTKPLKQFTSCDSLRTGGWVMREWKRRWNFIGAGCAHIFCLCLHLQVNFRSNVLQRGENETFGLTQILLHVYQLNINFSLLILSAYFSDVLGSLLSLCTLPWLIGLVYIQKNLSTNATTVCSLIFIHISWMGSFHRDIVLVFSTSRVAILPFFGQTFMAAAVKILQTLLPTWNGCSKPVDWNFWIIIFLE